MTNEQAKKMLKAKLECLKRETSGTDFDCNNSNCDECPLCYEQGNMGEQKEALDMAIKALEQQPCEDTISRQAAIDVMLAALDDDWESDYAKDRMCELPSAQPDHVADISKKVEGDCISRQATYLALVEKGQASKRYKLGETWELNGEEIREVLDALPSAQPEQRCMRRLDG